MPEGIEENLNNLYDEGLGGNTKDIENDDVPDYESMDNQDID